MPESTSESTPESTSTEPPSPTTIEVAAPWSDADFGELDEFLAVTNGEAFAIVEGGVTVHEWYRTDDAYARDIASAQKSVLSLLVGRAIASGFLGIDTLVDDVIGSGWTPHGSSSAISVRHLLTMTSGLDDTLALVSEPGTAWLYSGAFAQLFTVLAVATGRVVDDLASEWLFDPAGARRATFYERRTAEFAPIGMRATARDLVAIGQVVLDGSQPGLPAGWLGQSFAPSQPFNSSYGYLWWLNGQESFMLPGPTPRARPGSLIPTAPDDLVAALGKDDQKLYISREHDLVVARLGEKADPESRPALSSFDAALWAILDRLRTAGD
jgi:CubicO group peptidase (beta-lactamase class C family)